MPTRLAAIHVYPIKSCAPLASTQAQVEPRGLAGDRRWMIVDAGGRFITGRQQPRLTLIRANPDGEALVLDAPGMAPLRLVPPAGGARLASTVWDSTVPALPADDAAAAWISAYLGQPARFVFMDAACVRPVDPRYGAASDEVSFADGYPLLLISQAALDALNARLAAPVPMLRFRPSLVVAGSAPQSEGGCEREHGQTCGNLDTHGMRGWRVTLKRCLAHLPAPKPKMSSVLDKSGISRYSRVVKST